MPRNSSGAYSLYTPGNPVVTQTVISSSWANNTLSDLATAMTDSLSRSGDGGMLASLELVSGTSSAPGLSWSSDLTSGLYRAGASDFRWVNATVELIQLTTNLMQLSGTAPVFRINESDAAANNKLWDVIASGEDLNFRILTDALAATNWLTVTRTGGTVDGITLAGPTTFTTAGDGALVAPIILSSALPQLNLNETDGTADNRVWSIGANADQLRFRVSNDAGSVVTPWLTVDRTGTTVDAINFANGTLQYGGNEVGYRSLITRGTTGNDNTAASDNGRGLIYSGTGGHTFTVDSDFGVANYVMTVINAGSGNLTIAESLAGGLFWFNGSGTLGTGSRTLAVGGIATIYMPDTGNVYIWGTGLS